MPQALPFTDDPEANAYIAAEPMALLLGMLLDQQVPIEKAFSGPLELSRRLDAPLDAAALADMEVDDLAEVFSRKPALHRFPTSMAKKAHALATELIERYDGEPEAMWRTAADGKELYDRIKELPGFGEMKARSLVGILGKHFGVAPQGWEEILPDHMTLADVYSADDLAEYRRQKRARKAAAKG